MSTVLVTLLIVFVILLVLGVPLYCTIGLASVSALLVNAKLPLTIVAQKIYSSADSFTLLAVPFFILVGDLMVQGGISRRLVAFAKCLLGWTKGSMAYVTLAASALFGAISGSALATTSAIGGLMYPEMCKDNYPPQLASAIGAVGGTLGILIPPSIAFIVYGTTVGASIGDLFLYGGLAGIVFTIFYMFAARCELNMLRVQTPIQPFPTLHEVLISFRDAIWSLLAPVIILGGIYSGVFTAPEAAVVAALYSLIVGMFVFKELTWKKVAEIAYNSAVASAPIVLLIGVANVFSWIMTIENVAVMLKNLVLSIGVTSVTFLLIVNFIYLILGMLMETLPIIILTCPIFFPIAATLDIGLVHFGVITVCNLAFGLFTPPYGTCLFMASSYSKVSVLSMVKSCRFFYLFGIIALLAITYIPLFL